MPVDFSFQMRTRMHVSLQGSGQGMEIPGRIGIHYFPDTVHYREADLQTWLPELASLGISWLVLEADAERAIPEPFISGLLANKIQPVLRFRLPLDQVPALGEIQTLLSVYAKWGVQYVSFFDRPNDRSAWPAASWAQQDLVERFLDRFVPVTELAIQSGLTPLFPALEPGGSYWDTAFLRSALLSLARRKQERILASLAFSAYAWTFNRPLDWGAGGPESWQRSRPYYTPEGSQDQRGFHISDWYSAIIRSILHEPRPIFLFQAGHPGPHPATDAKPQPGGIAQTYLEIARLLSNEQVIVNDVTSEPLTPITNDVVCAAFWLLGSGSGSPNEDDSWYTSEGKPRPAAENIRTWRARAKIALLGPNRIRHYLLLPAYEWGIDEVHLQAIRPFLRKYRPAVGFSIDEAVLADSVTVIGDETAYAEEALNRLRQAGCRVERIQGDGTTIASLLAER
jgi:hypothetical protein